ncbi:sensor histidine kinase [Rathayibacter sp. VKM Ac-2856]|uniref:sensor histidine kinase n=1 Tax=unclassified Rathayibacter TaxID=2609250 RepID=UPI00156317E5|nr:MULTISPECIES: histidine kinase [unclassified Rathayibacter]NQX03489.1 sensor histidine kinase [Rathayibacter sp. VKM Ac-2858]NQX18657.1 sensor histidine kinase [Rathayibacter sp. VKM Ac-2856]
MTAAPDSRAWRRPPATPDQRRTDVVTAVVLFGAAVLSLVLGRAIGLFTEPASPALSAGVLALVTLPLAFRRAAPVPVLAVIGVTFILVGELEVPELTISNIALFMALYSVGAWEPRRTRANTARGVLVAVMGIWLLITFFRASTQEIEFEGAGIGALTPVAAFMLQQILINVLYFAGAWWFGDHAWASARQRALTDLRTRQLEQEQSTVARQAITIERLRIARELHDAVAHHVSLMGVQAGAARMLVDAEPARAHEQLQALEGTSRAAVGELYQLLGTLRDEESALEPVTASLDLDALPALVEDAAASGLRVSLEVVGEPVALPALVGLNLYRIAQESLTNVLKHAGPGTRARVHLRYTGDSVELEVADDGLGRPGPRRQGGGLGLLGMRERAATLDGSLDAGPRSGSGWVVRVAVPLGVRS